jgi:hypothetical protein
MFAQAFVISAVHQKCELLTVCLSFGMAVNKKELQKCKYPNSFIIHNTLLRTAGIFLCFFANMVVFDALVPTEQSYCLSRRHFEVFTIKMCKPRDGM